MNMVTNFVAMSVILSLCLLVDIASGQEECPSTAGYVRCATEGGTCTVPDSITQGYISYGVDGQWILVPFTNNRGGGADFSIKCDNFIGDISHRQLKYCCYTNSNVNVDTGFDAEGYSGYKNEGGLWNYNSNHNLWTQRFGAFNQYVYRPVYRAKILCDPARFGDPVIGIHRHCNHKIGAPQELQDIAESDWTLCGNEGDQCYGLDSSAIQWIRYGDNNVYFYQLVLSRDGSIECGNRVFDDPLPGVGKHCWRSSPQYTFTNIVGEWQRVAQCSGCSANTRSVTEGVSTLTESEITNTWGRSLEATASASYQFAEVSLSASVSEEVASRTLTQNTWHTEITTTITCAQNYLYQWVTGAESDNGINEQAFQLSTGWYRCTDSTLLPQCPPTFCADIDEDDSCQTCSSRFAAAQSDPVFILGDLTPMDLSGGPKEVYYDHEAEIFVIPQYIFYGGVVIVGLILICIGINCYIQLCDKAPQTIKYDKVYNTDTDNDHV